MSKEFTVAGTSTIRGVCCFRFGNSEIVARTATLVKEGHVDVNLLQLPYPMIKEDAIAYLATLGVTAVVPNKGNIGKVVAEKTVKAPKAAKVVKAQKAPKIKVAKTDAILAVLEVTADNTPVLHEALGFAASKMIRHYWDARPLTVRQEYSRNAAVAAGIACPKGTYPQLDARLMTLGVITRPDGTVYDK